MVSFNLKVLAKFYICSNCSQKVDECSVACLCSKKFLPLLACSDFCQNSCVAKLRNIGKNARAMNVPGNMLPRFADALLKPNNYSRKVTAKVESNLKTF